MRTGLALVLALRVAVIVMFAINRPRMDAVALIVSWSSSAGSAR